MLAFPNAKINLGLNVIEKRTDGFHNIETVFYPVNLCDVLEIVISDELGFASSGIVIDGYPFDNLCIKAYELLKSEYELPPVKIHLHKHIPIGAGLGGGSSDASYSLKVLNRIFGTNISDEKLKEYASYLGSDCAFFIDNMPVYGYEKGDKFEPINVDLSGYKLCIVFPDIHVNTKDAYDGIVTNTPNISVKEIVEDNPIEEWKHVLKNDFEKTVFAKYSEIEQLKKSLYNSGALYASMSGSGSAVYGIFRKEYDLISNEFNNKQVFWC